MLSESFLCVKYIVNYGSAETELNELERNVLEAFKDENTMTLKMIAKRVKSSGHDISKQRVWNILQLLCARNLIIKVEREVYRIK